ncbi:hypothetical protein J1605_011119 [Eschrichtius robustus]|uniref:Uncharacterized protein n=1 Tax=Eschrichtius robustus TaxID=9764 RepID=A0AB34GR75_ESCRO|nr:hypothetical protein J1605_011119 [Eschrichtius robustus]
MAKPAAFCRKNKRIAQAESAAAGALGITVTGPNGTRSEAKDAGARHRRAALRSAGPSALAHSRRPTPRCRLAPLKVRLPEGGSRAGGPQPSGARGQWGGPGSGQRLRPRFPIGRDAVGCPGARRGRDGAGRAGAGPSGARPPPPAAPAPLAPSPPPPQAAGVFKVGWRPRELDIRERSAAQLRRPSPPAPAFLRRPYNPRQCPETVPPRHLSPPPSPAPSQPPANFHLTVRALGTFNTGAGLREWARATAKSCVACRPAPLSSQPPFVLPRGLELSAPFSTAAGGAGVRRTVIERAAG